MSRIFLPAIGYSLNWSQIEVLIIPGNAKYSNAFQHESELPIFSFLSLNLLFYLVLGRKFNTRSRSVSNSPTLNGLFLNWIRFQLLYFSVIRRIIHYTWEWLILIIIVYFDKWKLSSISVKTLWFDRTCSSCMGIMQGLFQPSFLLYFLLA